ncbi:MAG: hypothetical protein WCG26_01395 [Chloroflexales bacterium]
MDPDLDAMHARWLRGALPMFAPPLRIDHVDPDTPPPTDELLAAIDEVLTLPGFSPTWLLAMLEQDGSRESDLLDQADYNDETAELLVRFESYGPAEALAHITTWLARADRPENASVENLIVHVMTERNNLPGYDLRRFERARHVADRLGRSGFGSGVGHTG